MRGGQMLLNMQGCGDPVSLMATSLLEMARCQEY